MTTRRRRGGRPRAPAAVLAAAVAILSSPLAPGSARAQSAAALGPPVVPDTSTATLRLSTKPEGLQVLIDGEPVGRSPLTLQVFAGTHRVAALPADPRQFSLATGERWVALPTGSTVDVLLDLRPPLVLRTEPEPSSIFLQAVDSPGADSLAGVSPLSLLPSRLELRLVRFAHAAYADTTVRGDSLVAAAASGSVRVSLRQIAPLSSIPTESHHAPVYRRSWFQWTLLGLGAALSASAIVFHNEADDWYQKYLTSSNPEDISNYYDEATHYDHLASISLISGQIMIVGGLYLLITNPSH